MVEVLKRTAKKIATDILAVFILFVVVLGIVLPTFAVLNAVSLTASEEITKAKEQIVAN